MTLERHKLGRDRSRSRACHHLSVVAQQAKPPRRFPAAITYFSAVSGARNGKTRFFPNQCVGIVAEWQTEASSLMYIIILGDIRNNCLFGGHV